MKFQRATAAAVMVAAAVTLTGCGNEHEHTGRDDHQVIDPRSPQEIDADQTAITAMQMILSWQPAVDTSKSDALVRAQRYLGGDLLAAAQSDTRADVRPDANWQQWASSKDALTATCVRSDSTPAAPAGMRTLVIDVVCTQTVLHATGQSTRLTPEPWRTTVTRTDDGWRLIDYRFEQ